MSVKKTPSRGSVGLNLGENQTDSAKFAYLLKWR